MGKFSGTKIAENRQYENPSDPANSNFTVIFEVTAPEAVIDPATGKKLSETIREHAAEIAATKEAAENARNTASTAKETANSAKTAATTAATAASEAKTAAQTAQSTVQSASSSFTPTAFSVTTSSWTKLTTAVAERTYKATITATGLTVNDIPDVYFNAATIAIAEKAGVIADCIANAVVMYAKSVPTGTVSGKYFIKKG